MHEDLTALIYQEERVRSFALKEEAAKFLAPALSDEWKRDYLATFTEPGEAGALQLFRG